MSTVNDDVSTGNSSRRKIGIMSRHRTRMFGLMITPFGWVILFTLLPMVMILLLSFFRYETFKIIPQLNIDNYIKTFHTPSFRRLLWRSFWNALIIGFGAVVVAYPLAYYITRCLTGKKIIYFILIVIPLWVSYLLRIYSWRVILGRNGFINTFLVMIGILKEPSSLLLFNNFAVTLVLTYISLPFAFIPIYVALEKIPKNLEEASRDLGAGGFKTFRKVVFPLSLPGLVTGGAFALILGFGDYVTPNLVGGTAGFRLSNAIEKWFGSGNNRPFGAAQAVLLLIVVLIVLGLVFLSGGVKGVIEE